jgi:hypothetical protein
MGFNFAGDQLEYINFPFTVPSGNCGQLETHAYVSSNSISQIEAGWEKLQPGTITPNRGIYWFHNPETECESSFEIEGHPQDGDVYGRNSAMEIEPKDIGVLSVSRKYENTFGLSEDDYNYSYTVVFNPFGYKVSIGKLMKQDSNPTTCDLKGVVLPNQWGFLHALISWSGTVEQDAKMVKDIMIGRDEIFIVICKEHYDYY